MWSLGHLRCAPLPRWGSWRKCNMSLLCISCTPFLIFFITIILQGCMNNISFGNDTIGYYETVAGGAGAGPAWNGRSGVHSHMTNTRITDPEILEKRSVLFYKMNIIIWLLLVEEMCCFYFVQISRHFRSVLSEAQFRRCREILWWRWRGTETSIQEQRGSVCTDWKTINPTIWPEG